jgi:carbamoyltransferase
VKLKFYDHQKSHATYAYYYSPFEKALSITLDGYGDGSFSKVFLCDSGEMIEIANSKFKNYQNLGWEKKWIGGSIGHIYSAFTTILLGFTPLSDEGKVEALAAFGNYNNRVYDDLMSQISIDFETDNLIINDTLEDYLRFENMQKLLSKYSKEDLSAAVQRFLEDIMCQYISHLVSKYKINNLCLSGGVFANVILNKRIFEDITPNIYITPAMADDGTTVGSLIQELIEDGYSYEQFKWLKDEPMPYFGPKLEKNSVLNELESISNESNIKYQDMSTSWHELVAKRIANGEIGALFNNSMEWGPRALGNRSIIADVRNKETTKKINSIIKNRPLFQPFCPSIMIDEKDRLFEKAYDNYHMTCAFTMKDEFLDILPSAVHIDGTARVQFVSDKTNPDFYKYLKELKKITGYGVSINTSFNKHGRTIVLSVQDAVDDFLDSEMDFMIIEGVLVEKNF